MTPGQIYRIKGDGVPNIDLFKRSHGGRLHVSSSNFLHFDISNGGPSAGGGMRVATNRILVDKEHALRVLLTVIRGCGLV